MMHILERLTKLITNFVTVPLLLPAKENKPTVGRPKPFTSNATKMISNYNVFAQVCLFDRKALPKMSNISDETSLASSLRSFLFTLFDHHNVSTQKLLLSSGTIESVVSRFIPTVLSLETRSLSLNSFKMSFAFVSILLAYKLALLVRFRTSSDVEDSKTPYNHTEEVLVFPHARSSILSRSTGLVNEENTKQLINFQLRSPKPIAHMHGSSHIFENSNNDLGIFSHSYLTQSSSATLDGCENVNLKVRKLLTCPNSNFVEKPEVEIAKDMKHEQNAELHLFMLHECSSQSDPLNDCTEPVGKVLDFIENIQDMDTRSDYLDNFLDLYKDNTELKVESDTGYTSVEFSKTFTRGSVVLASYEPTKSKILTTISRISSSSDVLSPKGPK